MNRGSADVTAFGLLFVLLFRIERRDRAGAWFLDVGAIIVAPLALWLAQLQNAVVPPWWFTVAVGLLLFLHVVRIEIVRDAKPRAFIRRYWFGVIPGRRRALPFESITTDNMFEDGWTNQVVFEAPGERAEFLQWCLFPRRIATWMQEQRARLALPDARVVETRKEDAP